MTAGYFYWQICLYLHHYDIMPPWAIKIYQHVLLHHIYLSFDTFVSAIRLRGTLHRLEKYSILVLILLAVGAYNIA